MSARDDLVRAMEAAMDLRNCPTGEFANRRTAAISRAVNVVEKHGPALLALLDAEPVAWIPVSDRLPKGDDDVAILADGDVYAGYYDGAEWQFDPGEFVYEPPAVTHWMPLPARPEASIAEKLRAKGFTERESNAQEETIRGLTK